MRPLSRPLGVVRIRWGICRRGWCRRCGCQGISRDTVVRRLAHEPRGWRPTILHVSVRRYRCPECAHVWRQDMSQAADPRAKLSRAAVRWALTGLVVHRQMVDHHARQRPAHRRTRELGTRIGRLTHILTPHMSTLWAPSAAHAHMQDRGTPPAGLMRQAPHHRVTRNTLAPAASTPPILTDNSPRQHCTV